MTTPYDSEPVDRLPFGSADKAARYATERYVGRHRPQLVALRPDAAVPRCATTSPPTSWPGPSRTSTASAR